MRYLNEKKANIKNTDYEFLETKHQKTNTTIYRTINFGSLKNKSFKIRFLRSWSQGDSLIKIANEVFGDSSLWWTIGLINNKPTDQHFNIGDDVFIPSQPDVIKNTIGE